jgi:hypothetical protein
VLQGRYKAVLVDKDSYLRELSRYIVLNPVRAHLCEAAGDWPWSSYRAVMGKAAAPERLAVAETLAMFSDDRDVSRRAYARFVADGTDVRLPESRQQCSWVMTTLWSAWRRVPRHPRAKCPDSNAHRNRWRSTSVRRVTVIVPSGRRMPAAPIG